MAFQEGHRSMEFVTDFLTSSSKFYLT